MGLENFKERRIERAVHSQQQKVQQGGNPDTDFEKTVGSEQIRNGWRTFAPIPSAGAQSEEKDGKSGRCGVSCVAEKELKLLEPQNLVDKPHSPGKEKEKIDNAFFKQRTVQ